MPTVTLNKAVFTKAVGKTLSDDELKKNIAMIGTDLEAVTKTEIIVEVFPNRPDMLSEQGFARAFSTFIGTKKGLSPYKITPSGKSLIIDPSVKEVRPWSACAIISNLSLNDEKLREIIQMQEKLHVTYGRNRKRVAIGIYPTDKIHFPITFKALLPKDILFTPLDGKKSMSGADILTFHPTGKEYGHLLEGKTHFPVFVDAKQTILSMPPLINSEEAGRVTPTTKEIFIECSGFEYRVVSTCLNMIVASLADLGGSIHSLQIQAYGKKITSPDFTPRTMQIPTEKAQKLLGIPLKDKDTKALLEKMGYGVEKGSVLIPAYRADVLHPVDLIEDIAIAYGYDKFTEEIPKISTIAQHHPASARRKKIGEILAGLGLLECSCYHLTSIQQQNEFMNQKGTCISLANSVTEEYHALPRNALPALLDVFKRNKHHELPQIIFTFLSIFEEDEKEETKIREEQRLALALCDEQADYTSMRKVLDYLFVSLGKTPTYKKMEHPSCISGRCASVWVEGKNLGFVGELHPDVLVNWQLEFPVAVAELKAHLMF